MNVRIETGARLEAVIVMIDDCSEGWHRSVVHIGRALSDVTQSRRLEGSFQLYDAGHDGCAAPVGIMHADVVEAVVAHAPTRMTRCAIRHAVEQDNNPHYALR